MQRQDVHEYRYGSREYAGCTTTRNGASKDEDRRSWSCTTNGRANLKDEDGKEIDDLDVEEGKDSTSQEL